MALLIGFLMMALAFWLFYEFSSCLVWIIGLLLVFFAILLMISLRWLWMPLLIVLIIMSLVINNK